MNINDLPGYRNARFLKILPGLYRDPLNTLTGIVSGGQKVIPFSFGKYVLFLVNDPRIIKHILKSNYRNHPRGVSLKGIFPLLGKGLFTSDHDLWVKQQKSITPAFHTRNFSRFAAIIDEESTNYLQRLEEVAASGEVIDLQKEFKVLMLQILVREMFSPGLKYDPLAVIENLDRVLDYTSIRGELIRNVKSAFTSIVGKKFTPPAWYTGSLGYLEKFVADFFSRIMTGELEPGSLTLILKELKEKGEVDDRQVRDEIMTFLFAGFDTVAEGLSWAQFLISTHPGTDEKILARGDETTTPDDDSPSTHKPGNSFLRSVINEALRLYPPAWAFYRIVTESEEIEDLYFPAKSYLMISPYLLHRTPKYWERAEEFVPERFLGEDQPEVNHFHYIPFGQGPHICTGRRLAMFEMELILAKLTPTFKFVYAGEMPPKLDPGIIMKAANGLHFRVEKR